MVTKATWLELANQDQYTGNPIAEGKNWLDSSCLTRWAVFADMLRANIFINYEIVQGSAAMKLFK